MSDDKKQYKGRKPLDSDLEKISKYVKVLDLFCQVTVLFGGVKYMACSRILPPLLSSLTKHMTVM